MDKFIKKGVETDKYQTASNISKSRNRCEEEVKNNTHMESNEFN